MLSRLRTHVRHNAVGYLALFFAMSGTALGANAALKTGDPAGGDLTGSYPNPSVAADAVGSAKVADSSLTGDDIADGAIGTAKFSGTIPAARARGTSAVSVSPITCRSVPFGAEEYDTAGLHAGPPGDPSRLTAPVDGIYRVAAWLRWDFNPNGTRDLFLMRTTPTDDLVEERLVEPGTSAVRATQDVSTDLKLEADDSVRVVVCQDSGNFVDLFPQSFTMSWVAPG